MAVVQPLTQTRAPATRRHYGVAGSLAVIAALLLANLAVYLVSLAWQSVILDGGLFGPAVDAGEWWRIATSGFLHAGWAHLISNATALIVLGLLLGNAIGPVRLVIVYGASLLGGSALALLLSWDALTVGASGAIFGLAGAAVVVGWMQRRIVLLLLAGGWAAANIVFTFSSPDISVAGHLGGLLAGAVTGRILVAEPRRLRSDGVSAALGVGLWAALFGLALLFA